jgi:acetyl-CoA carboxylase biotin carboxyl carrier protein
MNDKKAHGVEPELVRELAAILRETDLTEIEVEHGELRLRLARTVTVAAAPAPIALAPAMRHAASDAPAPAAAAEPGERNGVVPSPMVGTVYLSPEKGAVPFVKVGDQVSEGQTLLLIEAMKTFNQIQAPRAGTVREILVKNEDPVEFGEALLILE